MSNDLLARDAYFTWSDTKNPLKSCLSEVGLNEKLMFCWTKCTHVSEPWITGNGNNIASHFISVWNWPEEDNNDVWKYWQNYWAEICAFLEYYAASCGNCLPVFRDNVSVPSSRVKGPSHIETTLRLAGFLFFLDSWPLEMRPIRCPETSVNNNRNTQRNIPEESRSHQHGGGSVKSKCWTACFVFYCFEITRFLRVL